MLTSTSPRVAKSQPSKREEAPFLPFSKPSISQSDIDAVVEVLRSGWITTGPKVQELETEFCVFTGAKHSVAISSATGGMHIVLHALGIGPGDEVITPSMTWVSTCNLIVALGAKPIFVDVDPGTLMLDPALVEQSITAKTKAIIPVHYAGAPVDLKKLRAVATIHKIPLIEDAAHALGTTYNGVRVGLTGTAIFSFHPIKNMTTGEGGMICTDDDELAQRLRRLRFHGLGVDAFDRHSQGRKPQAEVIEPGFKYNLPDMNASLGLGQLRRLDLMNAQRSQLARYYTERLLRVRHLEPLALPEYQHIHAWHLYIVRLDCKASGMTRNQLMEELKAQGIGSGLHFRAVHEQQFYRQNYTQASGLLKHTEQSSARILSIPLFPDMERSDVDRVVDVLTNLLGVAE